MSISMYRSPYLCNCRVRFCI